jgi:hypothetical protein
VFFYEYPDHKAASAIKRENSRDFCECVEKNLKNPVENQRIENYCRCKLWVTFVNDLKILQILTWNYLRYNCTHTRVRGKNPLKWIWKRQQQSWSLQTSFTHVPNFWARFPLIVRKFYPVFGFLLLYIENVSTQIMMHTQV